jgi:hypothetical protein
VIHKPKICYARLSKRVTDYAHPHLKVCTSPLKDAPVPNWGQSKRGFLSKLSDALQLAADDENSPASVPKIRILGFPTRDQTDELALFMLRQLLDGSKYEVEIMTDAMLAAEVVARIGENSPAVICITALPPGGLAQTRYLCKRLRARFPDLKIAVGRWGVGSKDNDAILLAGADKVGTTTIETREQVIQLSQISPHAEAQSAKTATAFAPPDANLAAEVLS